MYRFLWFTLQLLLTAPLRITWYHRDRVPKSGPVILVGNHQSYVDPLVIALGIWRRIRFMAKAELWEHRALGWISLQVGAFPVRRATADRTAISTAAATLASGGAVGIFPQGSRHHAEESVGQGGAALIALRTGATVVPVGLLGTERIRPAGTRLLRFPRVRIVFGEPVDPAAFADGTRHEQVERLTRRIMDGIAEAKAEAERLERGALA